jgi:hypothetical protein
MEGGMSIGALLHVLQHSKALKADKLILVQLADHATDSGLSWPSHSLLARETGYTRQWVITTLDRLLETGALRQVFNAQGKMRYQLHVYDTKTKTCTCETTDLPVENSSADCQLSLQAPESNCELSSEGVNSLACNASSLKEILTEPLKDEPVKRQDGLLTQPASQASSLETTSREAPGADDFISFNGVYGQCRRCGEQHQRGACVLPCQAGTLARLPAQEAP